MHICQSLQTENSSLKQYLELVSCLRNSDPICYIQDIHNRDTLGSGFQSQLKRFTQFISELIVHDVLLGQTTYKLLCCAESKCMF
jgi:hypothetical protein